VGTNFNYADGETVPIQAQHVGEGLGIDPVDVDWDTAGGSNVNIADGNSRVGIQGKTVSGVTVVMGAHSAEGRQ
jgi:hypothetical protein